MKINESYNVATVKVSPCPNPDCAKDGEEASLELMAGGTGNSLNPPQRCVRWVRCSKCGTRGPFVNVEERLFNKKTMRFQRKTQQQITREKIRAIRAWNNLPRANGGLQCTTK